MSIETDLASLEILAGVYKESDLRTTFAKVVQKLQEQVPYFDWVGVYIQNGSDIQLEAASDYHQLLEWEANAELRIPIVCDHGELGRLVVRSKQPLCFDVTDVSTLETLAAEISKRMLTV